MVTQACQLLETTLATYWPGTTEVDAQSVRDHAKREGITLDEVITPLVALMARMAEHLDARVEMRNWILPADLDRKESLENRSDTLGRCLRLMAGVYFPRLKDAIGEWLFTVCDSDATILSGQIGYGNAAGYLFNKGLMSAPPSTSASSRASTSGGSGPSLPENINPITGTLNREDEDDGPEMTEEEKEREAEKLFVLFDRLDKAGIVEHPARKAIQEGKFSMGPFGP